MAALEQEIRKMDKRETVTMTAAVAKTAFKVLLDRVEAGETILIERHGKPTAKVGPVEKQAAKATK